MLVSCLAYFGILKMKAMVPLKLQWTCTEIYGVTTHKTTLFIVTAVVEGKAIPVIGHEGP
jgi:hypothetical protein